MLGDQYKVSSVSLNLFFHEEKALSDWENGDISFCSQIPSRNLLPQEEGRSKNLLTLKEGQESISSSGAFKDPKQRSTSSGRGEGNSYTRSMLKTRQNLVP